MPLSAPIDQTFPSIVSGGRAAQVLDLSKANRSIRVLSIDLDDTLWAIGPVIERAERALYAWLVERYPALASAHCYEEVVQMRVDVAQRFPTMQHDMYFLRKQALRTLAGDMAEAERFVDDAFALFQSVRNDVEVFADVRPALESLSRRFTLVALTNGNADLEQIGLAERFAYVISAARVGVAKPDPAIFAAVCAAVDTPAGSVLHIGDDPFADVEGARRAGFGCAWVNRHGRDWPAVFRAPDLHCRDLAELDSMLA